MMAGIDPHPAVKAISPQAPMIDVWMGDDFFHNGAFRQSYGYDYVLWDGDQQGEQAEVDYGKDKDGKPGGRIRLFPGARVILLRM
jgi:predicted acyl esterase